MREYREQNRFIYGNTARELAPERRPRIYENGKRVNESRRQLRERDRALQMNGPYVFILAVVCLFFLTMGVVYLGLQSDIKETNEHIVSLKNSINTQMAKNEAIDYSIDTCVSSDEIINIATTKLGMVEAQVDQVTFYKNADSEYTFQYGDIPVE